MSDIKISDLGLVEALGSADVLPIVQDGVTKKVSGQEIADAIVSLSAAVASKDYVNTAINGLITSSQIASVATTQLTGTITATQLGTTSNVQFQAIGVNTAPGDTGTIIATGNITAGYSDDNLKIKLGTGLDGITSISFL